MRIDTSNTDLISKNKEICMTETLVQWFVTHLGGKAAKELIILLFQ